MIIQFRTSGTRSIKYTRYNSCASQDQVIPAEAGILLPLIERLKMMCQLLGCLAGHQALIQAFGGEVVHAGEVLLHGKVSRIQTRR